MRKKQEKKAKRRMMKKGKKGKILQIETVSYLTGIRRASHLPYDPQELERNSKDQNSH